MPPSHGSSTGPVGEDALVLNFSAKVFMALSVLWTDNANDGNDGNGFV